MSTDHLIPDAGGDQSSADGSASTASEQVLTQFVVRVDGSVRGDDLAAGTLASAMPYYGRLARRIGELVGAGEPVTVETVAATRLTVQTSWTVAGEGLFRAVVQRVAPRAVPAFTVVGGVDVNAALAHSVGQFASVPGVHWSAVLASDTRVVAAAGHDRDELHHLPEIGTRMLAVLDAIDDRPDEAFARVDLDGVSVVAATVGRRHCPFALTDRKEAAELADVLDEVRAVLAPHDLATADTVVDAVELAPVAGEEPVAPLPATPPVRTAAAPPPVGARFRGVKEPRVREPRAKRLRRG